MAQTVENIKPTPPWADQIPEGAFISSAPTYKVGEYFNLYKNDYASGMKYYFFDPTEHGFEKGKAYPVLIFLHGYTNALEGDVCINYSGAEFFASPDYQKKLGGAYILGPLANEKRNAEGKVVDSWEQTYINPLYELINEFISKYADQNGGVSKKLLWGNSAGADMCFQMGTKYPEFFDVLIPVGDSEIRSDDVLDSFDANNVSLFLAIGKRDEFNDYYGEVVPRLKRLNKMKNFFLFDPDWVCNGDKGIASINFGVEMGQHCLVNPMACNLIFDDGTAMSDRLPRGLIDWINYAFTDRPFLVDIIETERLILRPLTFNDLPAIYKWTGDENTARYMMYPQYKSTADGVDWINSLYQKDGNLEYGFVWKATGELIGSGGVYKQQPNHEDMAKRNLWSIGYNIRHDMWGKGITTEAMRAIIDYARIHYDIKAIAGSFANENTASGHVMEKLGMTYLEDSEYSKFDGSATFKCKTYIRNF